MRTKAIVPYRMSLPESVRKCLPEPLIEGLRQYPFQVEGTGFLLKHERAILADDMGLGKTAQALVAAYKQGTKRILIVCPKTVRRVWEREIKKWLPEEEHCKISVICGGRMPREVKLREEGAKYFIMGYEHFRRHEVSLKSLEWDHFIFDEAHRMKERDTKITLTAQAITRNFRLTPLYLLTGTPVLNRPEEIWPLLNLISPYDFSSYHQFVEQYLGCEWKKVGGKWRQVPSKKSLGELTKLISPFILRRMKKDVLDLPEKTFEDIECEMEGIQLIKYNTMRDEMYAQLDEEREINATIILAQITRLKQIAVSHHLLDKTSNVIEGAKIDALMELLEDVGDQKVVIFSQFADAIRRLEYKLKCMGKNVVRLTGDMNEEQRNINIDKFQDDPECTIFLASIQAGGVGVTLTSASVAIFLDLYWTPAINRQAEDRLHRIGQRNPVTIYTLVAQDSIEDWIRGLLGHKEEMFDELIPVENLAIDSITQSLARGEKPF